MRGILGEQYDAFIEALENPRTSAFRVNPMKADENVLCALSEFAPKKIEHIEGAYCYTGAHIGNTAAHHSGAIYVQDAGAMCPVEALSLREGMRVLDVCAAPGGKSTQAAAKIGASGLLIANEYVSARAKILVENFERLGLSSAMVVNLDTRDLSRLYDAYFDAVICDAPCSGEGMFRKSDEALTHWSLENISTCAKRQKEILDNVAHMVKAGGELLYSTCTYAPEENEEVVRDFLLSHPDFRLKRIPEPLEAVTSPGIPLQDTIPLEYTRHFYPHISQGEGQYLALFERVNCDDMPTVLYKDASSPLKKEEESILRAFLKDTLDKNAVILPRLVGQKLVHVPHAHPVPPRSVFCAGVLLGEIRGKNFFPSHQFFSAFGKSFLRKLELSHDDERVQRYLHGEEICGEIENGWCVVCCDGVPLGGGKASGGRVKNHYPKGLRK